MADLVTVKTLKAHSNDYGKARAKAEGDTYALPPRQAAALAKQGLVEPEKDAGAKAKPAKGDADQG